MRYFILFAALSLALVVAYSIEWTNASWEANSVDFLGIGAMICTALAMYLSNRISKQKT